MHYIILFALMLFFTPLSLLGNSANIIGTIKAESICEDVSITASVLIVDYKGNDELRKQIEYDLVIVSSMILVKSHEIVEAGENNSSELGKLMEESDVLREYEAELLELKDGVVLAMDSLKANIMALDEVFEEKECNNKVADREKIIDACNRIDVDKKSTVCKSYIDK